METAQLEFIISFSASPLLLGAAAYFYLTARPSPESRLLALFLALTGLRSLQAVRFLFPDDPVLARALVETQLDLNLLSWHVFTALVWFYPTRLSASSRHGRLYLAWWSVLVVATVERFVARDSLPWAPFHDSAIQIFLVGVCASGLLRAGALEPVQRRVADTLLTVLILSPFTATGSFTVQRAAAALTRGAAAGLSLPEGAVDRGILVLGFLGPWAIALALARGRRSLVPLALLAMGGLMGALRIAGAPYLGVFTFAYVLRGLVPVHLGQRYGAFGLRRPGGVAALVLPGIVLFLLFLMVNSFFIGIAPGWSLGPPLGVFLGLAVGVAGAALVAPQPSWDAPARGAAVAGDGLILGRYRVIRPLGEGAQGVTRLCRDERLRRTVVVKTLQAGGGDALREARALAQVRHPNVVTVLDADDAGGERHVVMEHVEGGSLRARLARERRLPAGEAVRIVDGVLAGLEACHAAGIVHRDVKPENVLLASGGWPKLADFGLARDVGGNATILGAVGTLAYMAPEQVRGEAPDARSDVYAAGVLLQEILTGTPPLGARVLDDFEARERILRGVGAAELPDGAAPLRPVIARALARDRAERFPDAASMRAALAEAAAGIGRSGVAGAVPIAPRVPHEDPEPR